MKNLLVIAYYFPPSGGPGVQRVLKTVKYLPKYGWKPLVLTVENGDFPARDESLLKEIPEDVPVYRTKIFEPYQAYRKFLGKKGGAIDVNVIKKDDQKLSFKEKIAEFIRATFFIPDARMAWIWSSRKGIKKIRKEWKIDAVYSSSPPYTCSLIARSFKRETGVPWVAGFRDPWRGFISAPKRWFLPDAVDIYLEKSVFAEADAVECAWEGIIKDALAKYPRLNKNKFFHSPNGFDPDDYPKIEPTPNEKFTLTYAGSMYGRRNPAALFEAVEKLINEGKLAADDFLLRFIGRFGAEVEEMFRKASFKDSIEILPYLPHEKSVEYLLRSDVLLLVVDESKESEEIVPGKVFEYMGSKKPILAVAPPKGAIAALLDETAAGKYSPQSDVASIADIFFEFFEKWKKGEPILTPNEKAVLKYTREKSAERLAKVLDSLTGYSY